MADSTAPKKVSREARLRWVPISKMRINPNSQREEGINQARVDKLAANFDLEQLGTPALNEREDGHFNILDDGMHRIEALKAIGWGDQQVQCWVYRGLNDAEENETFLKLNDYLAVSPITKFRRGVVAQREVPMDIDRIVRINDLVVSLDEMPGAIKAVGTLHRIYTRGGPSVLGRTLRLARDAYGDPGLQAKVLDGLSLVCQRYNGTLNDEDAVTRLSKAHGGVNGLLGKAEVIHRQTGNAKGHCVAAAAVEIINKGGGKRLPSWWKGDSA